MVMARVFPSKTAATPDDYLVFDCPPPWYAYEMGITSVHVSVAFTWDKPKAEFLAEQWKSVAAVKIGGPAYLSEEADFVPGRYLKRGYVITSRGCINRCWFCSVWRRNPHLIELPITEGWNVLDDNILATSRKHQEAVFDMLRAQPKRARFTGGLDPKLFTDWHMEKLAEINAESFFFAYDTDDDLTAVFSAAEALRQTRYGRKMLRNHKAQCYVLVGYPGDTMERAEKRLNIILGAGLTPMAMLFKDYDGGMVLDRRWLRFQKRWARPAMIYSQKVRQDRTTLLPF